MPKIGVPTEKLKGLPDLPVGVYEVRFDGFEPKNSKKGDSVNLRPKLRVVNHPTLNDREVYTNMNTGYPPEMLDFTHAFGLPMEVDGDSSNLPGEFVPPDEPDPTKWTYVGPLTGRVGRVELSETDNGKGGKKVALKRYFCALPGCTEKHKDSLL